jgi:membrane-associated phospholipid phosphatase
MRLNRSVSERLARLVQPSDVINVAFVAFLLGVTLCFLDRVANPRFLIALYIGMLLCALTLIWFVRSEANPFFYFLRKWYPLAFVVLTFFSLGWLVHYVLPYDIDSELTRIDYLLFGRHPTVFLSKFMNPYLVDLLAVCYASFYFLPLIIGLALYHKRKMREFDAFVAIVCLGFYLSDAGNLLFPARGPSQTLIALHTVPLAGKWVGDFIRTAIYVLEPYRYDCFPSGHVAVTMLTVALAYRFERRLFWRLLPISIGLIFSTVYLRYHYVMDVAAGALLAGFILAGSEAAQRMAVRIRQPGNDRLRFRVYSVDKDIS